MSLTKQSVSAVKWSVLGTTFRFGLQLGAQIVLARLLGPENYGLFALGLIVLTFSNMLGNFGLAWGLVQTQNLSDEDVRFVFTWQLTSGFIVAIGVFMLAPALAIFFKEPRIELIIKWLSLACFLVALTAPASHLLRRKLDFKWISIIDVTSYTISYIFIGIPLAYYGAGVWTLVVAWLSQSFCALIFTFMRSPHPIKLLFWHSKARSITGVGVTVLLTNVCNWLLNNFDRILLGRFLNAQAVGLYTVPYNFANTPNSLLISALQPAFLAAGARIQEDLNRLRKVYLSVLATIWIVIVPMFVIMSMCAPDLMFVLYGSAWTSSGVILAILALAMPAYITWAMSTPILWNTNRKHWESLLQFPIIIIAGIAFYNFASQGGVIVAVVTSCVLLLRAIVITSAACHQLRISFRDISGYLLRGLVMSSITVAGCYFGAELGHLLGSGHWYGLLGSSLVATVMLIVISLYIPIILGGEVIEMLGRFSPSLSSLLKRRINTFAKVVSEL